MKPGNLIIKVPIPAQAQPVNDEEQIVLTSLHQERRFLYEQLKEEKGIG